MYSVSKEQLLFALTQRSQGMEEGPEHLCFLERHSKQALMDRLGWSVGAVRFKGLLLEGC
jgi:hypothetical protein